MCTDGDLVTIFDSSDLTYAIHCSKTLKLTLFGKYIQTLTKLFLDICFISLKIDACACTQHAQKV